MDLQSILQQNSDLAQFGADIIKSIPGRSDDDLHQLDYDIGVVTDSIDALSELVEAIADLVDLELRIHASRPTPPPDPAAVIGTPPYSSQA